MARFFALNSRIGILGIVSVIGFTFVAGCFAVLYAADTPPAPSAPAPAAPAKPPATNPPPAPNKPVASMPPAAPPPPPEYFERYGKILSSGEPSHPLKLSMPFPGVGEVKIPNQDELTMREKLEALATLSDDDIREQLNQWPAYSKMTLADEGTMLTRIQQFKERRDRIAQEKAQKIGLWSTLKPEQRERFKKEYWDKRLQMERELAKQFEPIMKERESKMLEQLFREFSATTPVGNIAQNPPPTPAPTNPPPQAQQKPAPGPTPPVAQGKPSPPAHQ